MTRVIKVGGRAQEDARLASLLALAAANDDVVIVHGGGDAMSALQQATGSVPQFVDGRRVTSGADIDLLRMALSGAANKTLVAALHACGVRAIGLSGEDGPLIVARPVDAERLGLVGAPCTVDASLLQLLMSAGYVPVISPVSRGAPAEQGGALNVNGDDAAAAVALALEAAELLLVSDVPGVLDGGAVVPRLSMAATALLMEGDAVRGGMRAKLGATRTAIAGGVGRVRITDVEGLSDPHRGTIITREAELE